MTSPDNITSLPKTNRTLLVVAAALIDKDNRVLLAERPQGKTMQGLWEFPGGKVEPHETPETALVRELHEELGLETSCECLQPLSFASYAYSDFHLLMPLYTCRLWRGISHPKEGQRIAWVKKEQLNNYAMPPADIPLVAVLEGWLR